MTTWSSIVGCRFVSRTRCPSESVAKLKAPSVTPGPSDLVIDPSYVVPAGSDQALADAILAHVDDGPETRQAVLKRARDHLSWQHAAELTTDVYRVVLATGGR